MSPTPEHILPVIMCGGSGSRLWPASRESMPKQFIPLLDEWSSFQATLRRVNDADVFSTPVVLTSHESRFTVAEQIAAAGLSAEIVLEPMRRDSAAAVAAATCLAHRRSPETIVLILAADHAIEDTSAFVEGCSAALPGARQGFVMTLGIKPTAPATGYGYIAMGEPLAGTDAFRVQSFIEKPDSETAARFIQSGYLWNSGYFLFRADVMMRELEEHAPAVLNAARAALEEASVDLDFTRLDAAAFAAAPQLSIDYAVMERTDRAGVLPVSFVWSDIGTWDALWSASPRDRDGNASRGPVELMETRNSLVHSQHALTAVVGLEGVVVVSTPDAVLVTSREHSGLVKDLVASLKLKAYPEAEEHARMHRPWGWYQRVDAGARFQVKRIVVKPGGRLSLQKHFHRSEHWVVVCGTAEVTVGDRCTLVHENESIYIPIGSVHRLANPGKIPLELIEVQTGSYLGEDDIIRVEDVYGRSAPARE